MVTRDALLDDAQWNLIEPLLPAQRSGRGRPMRDHRQVVEGILYRYRCGIAWRDLPASFGPWQTVWKRHRRFSGDGTWDTILATLLAQADSAQEIDWTVSVDSTINRAHQHATNLPREPKTDPSSQPHASVDGSSASVPAGVDGSTQSVVGTVAGHTGGSVESQGFCDPGRSGRC